MRRRGWVLAATVALVLSGCGSSNGSNGSSGGNGSGYEETPMNELTGEWQLTKGADADGSWAVNGIPVTLVIADETVSGQAPCNAFTGESSVNGTSITIGRIASTLKACEDNARTQLETRYLAALEKVTTAKITDGAPKTLTLTGTDETLKFTIVEKKSAN